MVAGQHAVSAHAFSASESQGTDCVEMRRKTWFSRLPVTSNYIVSVLPLTVMTISLFAQLYNQLSVSLKKYSTVYMECHISLYCTEAKRDVFIYLVKNINSREIAYNFIISVIYEPKMHQIQ